MTARRSSSPQKRVSWLVPATKTPAYAVFSSRFGAVALGMPRVWPPSEHGAGRWKRDSRAAPGNRLRIRYQGFGCEGVADD